MLDEIEIWRVWAAGKATLNEMETTFSFDDLQRAIAMMEVEDEIQRIITPKIDKMGKGR